MLSSVVYAQRILPYKDVSLSNDQRIADLLSRMTLEEKAAQLDMLAAKDIVLGRSSFSEKALQHYVDSMNIGIIHDFYPETAEIANIVQRRAIKKSRLGIPLLFVEEGLHGYMANSSTVFPIPLGYSCSWDSTMIYNIGRVIGTEARAHGVHFILAPNLDLAHEPRWGRVEETYGEDSYLASRMAVNMVKGMQGNSLKDNNSVAAEPKHFGVHGVPEGGSNAAAVSMGEREAREVLFTFEKAIKEGHARGVMAAYHDIDGIPCVSNPWLLKRLLRDEWGFNGFVLSDLGAIARQEGDHRTAASHKEAIVNSLSSGLDAQFYDYPHDVFQQTVVNAVKDGSLSLKDVDRAVGGILRVKFELGLFDNPYTDKSLVSKVFHCQEHQDLALQAGRESIVLLQNNDNALPLKNDVKRIALIGNLADVSSIGDYSPRQAKGMTIYEALKNRFGDKVVIDYVKQDVTQNFMTVSPAFVSTEVKGKQEQGLQVEYFNNSTLSGKPTVTVVDGNLSPYWHNLSPAAGINDDHFSVRWSGSLTAPVTGMYEFYMSADNYARFSLDGKSVIDFWGNSNKYDDRGKVYLEAGHSYKFLMEMAELTGNAGVNLEWRLAQDSSNDDYFSNITKAASKADAVVVVLGEYNSEVGEGKDRQNLNLHPLEVEMVNAAAKSGKKIVTVVLNGRPLVLTPICNNSSAMVEAWFPGEAGGKAVTDVLFGDYNPSGKLTMSFPKAEGQLPIYYARKSLSLRRYTDGDGEPLFTFGHGLSYSTFEYSDLEVSPKNPTIDDNVTVSLKVRNASNIDGTEVVQLYVQDRVSSVSTPIASLKSFSRVFLKAGETKEVKMCLTPEQFSLINRDMKRVTEPGEFLLFVGSSFKDIRLKTSVTLSEK
jgi:beta-glucosidase